MPCRSDYLAPTAREIESQRVLEFLGELAGVPFDHEHPHSPIYGDLAHLDRDTAALCDWCKTHDVKKQSLELQVWWQRHQKHDADREAKERLVAEQDALKQQALAKLTPEERELLKLK